MLYVLSILNNTDTSWKPWNNILDRLISVFLFIMHNQQCNSIKITFI